MGGMGGFGGMAGFGSLGGKLGGMMGFMRNWKYQSVLFYLSLQIIWLITEINKASFLHIA